MKKGNSSHKVLFAIVSVAVISTISTFAHMYAALVMVDIASPVFVERIDALTFVSGVMAVMFWFATSVSMSKE